MIKNYTFLRVGTFVFLLLAPMKLYAVVGPQNVSQTVHNMAYDPANPRAYSSEDPSGGPGTLEVCVFCHTPHNSSTEKPLWNRYSSSGAKSFLTYTSSSTLTSAVKYSGGITANSVSRLCLSCHDGTVAINALVITGATGGARPDMVLEATSFSVDGYIEGEGAYLGTNLTNMHPINFNYDDAQTQEGSAGLNLMSAVDLKFFDDNGDGSANFMECPTCHDPHVNYGYLTVAKAIVSVGGDSRYYPFLRKPNVSSALCLTCHNK